MSLVANTLKEHRWFFNYKGTLGDGMVFTDMPEASDIFTILAEV